MMSRIGALAALLSVFSTGPAYEGEIATIDRVDETLTREVDVTGDGKLDLIALNFRGESWQAPFRWTLTIKSMGKVIFEHKSDDTWMNPFFADKDYVLDCTDYVSCKKKYYERDILEVLVDARIPLPDSRIFDRDYPRSIYEVARDELVGKYHVSESQASLIIAAMISRLQSGGIPVLLVPVSAVQANYPIMYAPEVSGFVRIYEW